MDRFALIIHLFKAQLENLSITLLLKLRCSPHLGSFRLADGMLGDAPQGGRGILT
jgi:hypothetical protein